MPFEELTHTADWSLRVWAPDLNQLFTESARGMYALAGIRLAEKPRVRRLISLSSPDVESLLVSFLSELVYISEQDRLAFDQINLSLDLETGSACHMSSILRGAPILSLDKAIKAVTYHNLKIQQSTRGYESEIVFDV
jgi:SHS2 domain-containing protein